MKVLKEEVAMDAWEEEEIESLHREYERTANPLCVWNAIAVGVMTLGAIPKWVEPYLHSVACQLMVMAIEDKDQPRKTRAAMVMKALGLSQPGRGRKPDHFDYFDPRWARLAFDVRKHRESGLTYQDARIAVARAHGVSWSVVDRACKTARESE